MSELDDLRSQDKKSAAGRKSVVTEAQVREVIEAFRREGRPISTAGIKGVTGGSTQTVARILEKLGDLPVRIDVTSPLPISLSKAFQQCVQDQTLSVRVECQKQIDGIRELLDQVLCMFLDTDKECKIQMAEVEELRTRCEALQAEVAIANLKLDKVSAELRSLRQQAADAVTAEAVMGEQLKSALASAQRAEAQLEDERRWHEATRSDLARSQETLAGVNLQAAENLRALQMVEEALAVERRRSSEYFEKLIALLGVGTDRETGFKYVPDEAKDPPGDQATEVDPATDSRIEAGIRQWLGNGMSGRAHKPTDWQRREDDDTIPF